MKRTSTKVITGVTDAQANEALGRYAKASSRTDELNAQIEQGIIDLRKKREAALAMEADIMKENERVIQSYAAANPQLFVGKKSVELQHGTIGYSTNPPSLKTTTGFTWATALEKVKKYLPEFVRTKEEVDKASLLTQREEPEIVKALTKCGIEVKQEEEFYIKLKVEA